MRNIAGHLENCTLEPHVGGILLVDSRELWWTAGARATLEAGVRCREHPDLHMTSSLSLFPESPSTSLYSLHLNSLNCRP